MSAEGAKERVTLVPSKSKLPTYFRFGEALAASCSLSPTYSHVMMWGKLEMAKLQAAELLLDSEDIQEEIEVGTEPPQKKRHRLRNKKAVAFCRRLSSIESSEPPLPNSRSKMMRDPGISKSHTLCNWLQFALTLSRSLGHDTAAAWSKSTLSKCKISHVAITEHVGFLCRHHDA